jgi:hypothetical protein
VDCTFNVALGFIGGTDKLIHTPSKPLAEVKNRVHQILEQFRPTMRTLVTKAGREPLIPPWILETENEAFETHQAQYIKGIFSSDRHKCVYNYDSLCFVDEVEQTFHEYFWLWQNPHRPSRLMSVLGVLWCHSASFRRRI